MVLSLLVLVIVGIVAYFHFIQGFFSAALSAILAIIAAVVAVGFHEYLIASVLQGKMAEMSHSLVLVGLFALTYIILRLIFDAVVPGNVQVPLMVDKVGAGVMGVIAGIFAAGVFAIAAQALPFGPAVAGFARYEVVPDEDISFTIPGNPATAYDAIISGALKDERLSPGSRQGLLLPADGIVLGTTSHVSGNGALAGAVAFSTIHPNYIDELFFQRIGIQVGGKRVAYNTASDSQVRVDKLFTVTPLPQVDSEHLRIQHKTRWTQPPEANIRSEGSNIIVIARVGFAADASDSDNNVRLSPASVRLVAGGQNHLPLGTLDYASAPFVRKHRPDDFLIMPGGGVVDLVYYVSADLLGVSPDMRSKEPWKITTEAFIEAKRLGIVPLTGLEIVRQDPGHPTQATVMRKGELPMPRGMTVRQAVATGAGTAAVAGSPIESVQAQVSPKFIAPVQVGRYEGDVENHTFSAGTASIKEGKFAKVEINPGPAVASLTGTEFVITDLWAPGGRKVVQINAVVATGEGVDPWAWATGLAQFQLIDGDNNPHQPHGAWAKVKQGTTDTLIVRYNAEQKVTEIPKSNARPTDVCLLFVVPDRIALSELKFGTVRVASVNLQVP